MANKPFDLEVINVRERPLSTDLNLASSYQSGTLRYLTRMLSRFQDENVSSYNRDVSTDRGGFIADAFLVKPTSPASLNVVVKNGLGFVVDPLGPADSNIGSALVPGISGLNDLDPYRPIILQADHTFAVPTPDPVNARIDIIEVKVDRRLTDAALRAVLDPGTGVFNPTNVFKTLEWAVDGDTGTNTTGGNSTAGLSYKTGTPAVGPVAPATSAGYVKVAEIRVPAAATTITGPDNFTAPLYNLIKDTRVQHLGSYQSTVGTVDVSNTGAGAPVFLYNNFSHLATLPPSWRFVQLPETIPAGGGGSINNVIGCYLIGPEGLTGFLDYMRLRVVGNLTYQQNALYNKDWQLPAILQIVQEPEVVTVTAPLQTALAAVGADYRVGTLLGQKVWHWQYQPLVFDVGGGWAPDTTDMPDPLRVNWMITFVGAV